MKKIKQTTKEEILEIINNYLIPNIISLMADLGLTIIKIESINTPIEFHVDGTVRHYSSEYGWKKENIKSNNIFNSLNSEFLVKIMKVIGNKVEDLRKKKYTIVNEITEFKKSGIFIEVFEREVLLEKYENNKR